MLIKLYNEEFLRANILFSVTLTTGNIYFISSWSVSRFEPLTISSLVQEPVHNVVLKEYCTFIFF